MNSEIFFCGCGVEFFQVKWFEIGHVFKTVLGIGPFGHRDHVLGQGNDIVKEMCVGMSDNSFAFLRAIAKEIHILAGKRFSV